MSLIKKTLSAYSQSQKEKLKKKILLNVKKSSNFVSIYKVRIRPICIHVTVHNIVILKIKMSYFT